MNRPYSATRAMIAENEGARRNGKTDDGRGWFRTAAEREECYAIADAALEALADLLPEGAETRLPDHLRGDGPCQDCGTPDNILWTIESVFWNRVLGGEDARDDPGGLLCVPCFVKRADAAGFVCRWRLAPEWHWETKAERAVRLAEGDSKDSVQDPSVPVEETTRHA